MKILGLSESGNLCGLLSWAAREGAEVRLHVRTDLHGFFLKGMVTPVDDWRQNVDWADVVYIDDPHFWRAEELLRQVHTPCINYGRSIQDLWDSREAIVRQLELCEVTDEKAVRYMLPICVSGPMAFMIERKPDFPLYTYRSIARGTEDYNRVFEQIQPVLNILRMSGYIGFLTIDYAGEVLVDLYDPRNADMVEAMINLIGCPVVKFLTVMISEQRDMSVSPLAHDLTCCGTGVRSNQLEDLPQSRMFAGGMALSEENQLMWMENEVAARVYTHPANRQMLADAVTKEPHGHA